MMYHRVVVAGVIASCIAIEASQAQHIGVSAIAARTNHELLPNALGVGGSLSISAGGQLISVILERVSGDENGRGVVCAGLVNPEACPPEPLVRDGSQSTLGVGAEIALWETRVVQTALIPHLLLVHTESDVRGRTTGNTLHANRSVIGFSGAVETRLTPAPRAPISLVLGAAARRVGPIRSEQVLDGYTPFDNWYTVTQFYAGGAIRWGRD